MIRVIGTLMLCLAACSGEPNPHSDADLSTDADTTADGDSDVDVDSDSDEPEDSDVAVDSDLDGAGDSEADVDADADLGFCVDVSNWRGVVEAGDPLWIDGRLEPWAFDFDGDLCPDGVVHVGADGVRRVALDGESLWSWSPDEALQIASLAQAGDFTGDGVIDLIVPAYRPTGVMCGVHEMVSSVLLFFDGATGALEQPAAPLDDICWTFPTATYPTRQYAETTLFLADFAPGWAGLEPILFPYYATMGWALNRGERGAWVMLQAETDPALRHLYFPSTASFDADYLAANGAPCQPTPWGSGQCYVEYSHVANPVLLEGGNLLVLTSGRAVSYQPNLAPTGDHVWAAGGRTDHGGRNYGLLTRFAIDGVEQVTLHGGCHAFEMKAAIRADDGLLAEQGNPLCGIHRHYELFGLTGGVISDHTSRFYSYASTPGVFEGRLQYPRHAILEHGPSGAVFTAYNLYTGGRWTLRIGDPRLPDAPSVVAPSTVVWDVRDLDGDGAPELLVSELPIEAPASSPASLLPPWSFSVLCFDGVSLRPAGSLEGWLPASAPQLNRSTVRSSDGFMYPAAVTDLENDSRLELVVEARDGALAVARWTSDELVLVAQ